MKLLKHRWRLLSSFVLLLVLSGLPLVPQVHWPIYGWLRGEAFYQGMPTNWWAQEIEESYYNAPAPNQPPPPFRSLGWLRETDPSLRDQLYELLVRGSIAKPPREYSSSPLLGDDWAALPVLLELLQSPHSKVRRVAVSGLTKQATQMPEVVSLLRTAVHDPDEDVQLDASEALRWVSPEDAEKALHGIK